MTKVTLKLSHKHCHSTVDCALQIVCRRWQRNLNHIQISHLTLLYIFPELSIILCFLNHLRAFKLWFYQPFSCCLPSNCCFSNKSRAARHIACSKVCAMACIITSGIEGYAMACISTTGIEGLPTGLQLDSCKNIFGKFCFRKYKQLFIAVIYIHTFISYTYRLDSLRSQICICTKNILLAVTIHQHNYFKHKIILL